ncbi:hypothetical protein F5148DRAFT_1278823 [Russula earlei]|uniref:Uncharacterized protein n=1 Tax=Russula earlei TaxID=71964 RepID=A0ACC0UQF2_9AGAM|nr:hypothetical protein F5148DRAFT_1278823 [Russula earlei]
MSFLSFRHARRKAKKMVGLRHPRPPTPPSPSSFAAASVVEIGDPSRPSAERLYRAMTPQVDIDIVPEPLFPSDPFVATFRADRPTATSHTQSRDRRSRSGSGSPPKAPHNGAGLVQPMDYHHAGPYVAGDGPPRAQSSRRAAKPPPAPIKIPPTSLGTRVQIQRSGGRSAEPHRSSTHPGHSPVHDDGASVVSDVTLPGAFIANVWAVHADHPHHRFSRRITRLDSATLPIGENPFMNSPTQKQSRLSTGDGEFHVPLIAPRPAGVNDTPTNQPASQDKADIVSADKVDEGSPQDKPLEKESSEATFVSRGKPCSPITELPTPDVSEAGTPDLIKDSSTSAEEDGSSSDAQPDMSASPGSAPSAWSGLASSTSPGSGINTLLERFPSLPSASEAGLPASSPTSSPARERNPGGSRNAMLAAQRRRGSTADARRPSRLSARPSLASVNNLLLHPATLLPIGDRRVSSIRSASESPTVSQRAIPDDPDNKRSGRPSSRPATRSRQTSPRQRDAPSSALTNTAFQIPLRSSSPAPSPDLLDSLILSDDGNFQRRISAPLSARHAPSDVFPFDISAGEPRASHVRMSMPVSGHRQTFPETPYVFSPMFSPGVGYPRGHALSYPESSTQRQPSAARSLRSGASMRFIVGGSASTRVSRIHKLSSKGKPKRSSSGNHTPMAGSTLPTTTNGRHQAPEVAHSQGSARNGFPDSQKKTIPSRFTLTLPPPPPSLPPSPQEIGNEPPSGLPSPLFSLLPPPPPPQLHPPPPPSKPSVVSPRPPSYELPPSPLRRERSSSSDSLTAEDRQPDVPLAAPSALPDHAPVNRPLNTYSSDRPHRPLGPRAPYRNVSSNCRGHARLPSNASAESVSRMSLEELLSGTPNAGSVPRFRTSPPKFKGLTMEAAKWTFSSAELHVVVSEAIKQSGQPSSIRLLSPEAAFLEVPQELERLDALLQELRVQYRLQVRKRDVLLKATYAYTENPEFSSIALRSKLQELHETATNLDRIAEMLYCTRDQAAQLSWMLAVHSGSALAMALRKLHSSYLKRTAEVQILREQVSVLESEREEAWAQAQQVARDLDDLNDTLHYHDPSPCGTRPSSHRSSRVVASCKSSVRMSRGGFWLSHGQPPLPPGWRGSSQWSHLSVGGSTPSSHISSLPTVPVRPSSLRRIITSDLPSQKSVPTTPSVGSRALARAQADLYGYLGIDDPELMPPPPWLSPDSASPRTTMSPVARSRQASNLPDRRMTWGDFPNRLRRASMENEPEAMLATFDQLDD